LKYSPLGIRDELLGKLSLREMMLDVLLAGKVVINFTDIIHLAAALGTPTVGIYTSDSANSERVWRPLGRHASCLAPTIDDDCEASFSTRIGKPS
jgi:ADP-heptose:LPS heptosyltransferase